MLPTTRPSPRVQTICAKHLKKNRGEGGEYIQKEYKNKGGGAVCENTFENKEIGILSLITAQDGC